MRWEPAIYEHKAALLNLSPAEVANSVTLLTDAVLKEYEVYKADYITVGLDVYNIEAEALGADIIVPGENACPDIAAAIFDLNALPTDLIMPAVPQAGRFQLLIDTSLQIRKLIGDKTTIRVAASGPVTLAAKLVGVEDLIMSLCMEDGYAVRILEFTTQLAEEWCRCIRSNGLEAILFDSMVAPPMFTPDMYQQIILPMHSRLMSMLEQSGQKERELVIGGNTSLIAGSMKESGATAILCDYASDAAAFKAEIGDDSAISVRRNINPAMLSGDKKELAEIFTRELDLFSQPIAGTGILPYDFIPANLVQFMHCLK